MATKAVKLPSGNYRSRAQWDKGDGKQHYKSFTASSAKEAVYLAAQFEVTQKEKFKPKRLSVGAAIDEYIEARSSVLSPATIRSYKQIRRLRFGLISNIMLSDLRSEHAQRQINAIAAKCRPKTVANAFALLSSAVKAYHPDLALRVDLPRKVKTEIEIPSKADVSRLLSASRGTPLENAILLAAGYGMRRGEISALLYSDIVNNTITVNKSYAKTDNGSLVIKSPKSYAGTRTFSIAPEIAARLRENAHDHLRVCPITPDAITRRFERTRDRLGIRVRFHALRHYNASLMLSLNVPDKYAMERLGQSTPGMIKAVYQHIMDDKRDSVANAVNAAVSDFFSEKI